MTNEISIVLPGIPRTKLRPRFSRFRGKVKTYDKQKDEKETDTWRLKARMKGREPLQGTLSLTFVFIFKKPKSAPKRDVSVFHRKKPDVDNLIKWICDVGNNVLWHDDRQIASVSATKIYGDEPRTIIIAQEIE